MERLTVSARCRRARTLSDIKLRLIALILLGRGCLPVPDHRQRRPSLLILRIQVPGQSTHQQGSRRLSRNHGNWCIDGRNLGRLEAFDRKGTNGKTGQSQLPSLASASSTSRPADSRSSAYSTRYCSRRTRKSNSDSPSPSYTFSPFSPLSLSRSRSSTPNIGSSPTSSLSPSLTLPSACSTTTLSSPVPFFSADFFFMISGLYSEVKLSLARRRMSWYRLLK